jgi:excisionase family DNA binding protein
MEGAMIVTRKTVTIEEACKLVGVSRRTIHNWMDEGKVKFVRTAGGRARIFADTLWKKPESKVKRSSFGRQQKLRKLGRAKK